MVESPVCCLHWWHICTDALKFVVREGKLYLICNDPQANGFICDFSVSLPRYKKKDELQEDLIWSEYKMAFSPFDLYKECCIY